MNSYKQFNWIVTYLLSLVTCGIYGFYVFGYMGASSNAEAERYGCKKIMNFVPALLLGFVTCGIFLIVWYYQFMKQQVEIARAKGVKVEPTEEPILLVLILYVPFYSYYVLCENYNRVIPDQKTM
ncbi:MAG: DUF4234 domain-containing protein [Ruminococcaceae bacterium]|nr:DUF4234 domain-containing protein [Oscillospiraceae bacterium]MBR3597424.1 DUF4234 domain-containing protein [Clostridia bacterium]